MPRRLHILPPHSHWPWIPPLAVLSLAWSFIVYYVLFTPLSPISNLIAAMPHIVPEDQWPQNLVGQVLGILLYTHTGYGLLFFLLGAAILWRFAGRCGHPLWLALYGAVYGGALPVACFLLPGFDGILNPNRMECVVVWLLIAVGGTVMLLTIAAISFLLQGAPTHQDGTHCPACAYDISHSPPGGCSECGAEFSREDLTRGPNPRRAVRVGALVIIVTLIPAGGIFAGVPYVAVPAFMDKGGAHAFGLWTYHRDGIDCLLDLNPWQSDRLVSAYLEHGTLEQRRIASRPVSYRRNRSHLGLLESRRLVAAVLSDPDDRVRKSAMKTVLTRGHPTVLVEAVARFVGSKDERVRAAYRRDGRKEVLRLLWDSHRAMRAAAHEALTKHHGLRFEYSPEWDRDRRYQAYDQLSRRLFEQDTQEWERHQKQGP
jgi:hypothetical protein